MKLLILLVLAVVAYADASGDASLQQLYYDWMELPLDHFNLFDNRTWKMRYFVNNEFFEQGRPLFIDVAGEWEANVGPITAGQMYELAKKHKGLLIQTEHRYYGESLPFGKDFSVENLKYLQIEQALEDLAYFIEHYKSLEPRAKYSKVVVHGCSYPGMLVTWMRLKFPHIVDIAYASSATLGVGLNYPEYYQVVHDVYANVSQECVATIKKGFNQTHELMKTKLGLQTVRDALRSWSCGDIDDMNSDTIIGKMVEVLNVMDDPIEYEQLSCLIVTIDDISAFHMLANFIIVKSVDKQNCADEEDPTGISERTSIAWSYQSCTQMGTFPTLDRKDSRNLFQTDLTVEELVDECVKSFRGIVTKDVLVNGIERVERRYGGKKPLVTKVLTVQGTHDPWKHLAALEDYNPEAPVMVIEGSHCIDVSESEYDPASLVEVRKKIRDTLSKWIEEIS